MIGPRSASGFRLPSPARPEETWPAHGIVVLAAGASARLGQPKQLLRRDGETLVRRAARLALETGPGDALVVLGCAADAVFSEIADLPLRRVDCAAWQRGLGASLRAGIDALSSACAGVLVVLCDQPRLDARHLHALCAAWRKAPERGVASFYAHRPGVPALLPRAWFAALDATSDRGMRDLLRGGGERLITVANEALALDADRPVDLRHLR